MALVFVGCGDDDGRQQQCGDGVCEGTETIECCPLDCADPCEEQCLAADESQCLGSTIQVCVPDAEDGCLVWEDSTDCSVTGSLCEDASGIVRCVE